MNYDHPYILDILFIYYCVFNQDKIVNFRWNPSHIGIHVNNEANMAAKSALEFETVKFKELGTVRIISGPVTKFDFFLKKILQPHVGFRTVLFS